MKGLAYIGKIIKIEDVIGADRIESATVICGTGGKWRGVISKGDFSNGEFVIVYLPDAILLPSEHLAFMEKHKWRVKMCRFKGVPSEVLITKITNIVAPLGTDVTQLLGVTKHEKPVPANLQGQALDAFPGFIPKTDEPNYQKVPELVALMQGKPYYISEKVDGSSTTAYKFDGHFGVCSRNFELVPSESNGFWQMAAKYDLEKKLPDGIALQWETAGPGVQSNPMGLSELSAFAFSAYDIKQREYLSLDRFLTICDSTGMPNCKIVENGLNFEYSDVSLLGEGKYPNDTPREGVVVRTQNNYGHAPISFKIINLAFEEAKEKRCKKKAA